jgi:hypothetical protein
MVPKLGRTKFRTANVYQRVRQQSKKRQVAANLQMRKKVSSHVKMPLSPQTPLESLCEVLRFGIPEAPNCISTRPTTIIVTVTFRAKTNQRCSGPGKTQANGYLGTT